MKPGGTGGMLPSVDSLRKADGAEAFSLLLATRGQHLTMLRELAQSHGTRNLESDLRGGLGSRLFRVAAAARCQCNGHGGSVQCCQQWRKHNCALTGNFHGPAFFLHFWFNFVSNALPSPTAFISFSNGSMRSKVTRVTVVSSLCL